MRVHPPTFCCAQSESSVSQDVSPVASNQGLFLLFRGDGVLLERGLNRTFTVVKVSSESFSSKK